MIIFVLCFLTYTSHITEATSYYSPDYIVIRNRTSGDIFIEIKLWEEMKDEHREFWSMFVRKVNGLQIRINIHFNKFIEPNTRDFLLQFMPDMTYVDQDPYGRLRAIPLLEILGSIIESLKITNAQGDALFSLEDAHEEDFIAEKLSGSSSIDYFLEIYDP
jgi:hypothetical protein